MFDFISEKFQKIFSSFSTGKKLTEENLSEAVSRIKTILLDADVNFSIANNLIERIKEKAINREILKSLSPSDQFVKIVHDELVCLMGDRENNLYLKNSPSVIMMCGLQGSGKTTQAAKLASFLKDKNKVLLSACDLQRPAAVQQLKKLASQLQVELFFIENEKNPATVAKKSLDRAVEGNFDVLIVDTAGRTTIDESSMKELKEIKDSINPCEILFVANSATGQVAVETAIEFDKRVSITGTILTMLDGNARAGAAISIVEATKKPLKFEGTGEKIDDLQIFNPKSMADRILGLGDVINLVKKIEKHVDEKEQKRIEKKLKKSNFTYGDFIKQMSLVKKMGSLTSLMKMVPGLNKVNMSLDLSEESLKKVEAIILSMTARERLCQVELIPGIRKRLAFGSGTKLEDVNKMVKRFKQAKKMFKNMKNIKAFKNFI